MRGRTRKLIGAAGLLALAAFWPLSLLAFGAPLVSRYYFAQQFMFLLLLGLIWAAATARLVRWMRRPDGNADGN